METSVAVRSEVDIRDQPVQDVVVYPDRAQVTRKVRIQLAAGTNEVSMRNLSSALDKDSIRVDGVGAATITEVSFQEKPVTKEEKESVVDPDTELSQLRDQLAELQQQKTELEGKKKRIAQKQELMEGYCNSLMDSSENTESEPMLKKDSIDEVFSFLEQFSERSLEIKISDNNIAEQLTKLDENIQNTEKRLKDLGSAAKKSNEPETETVIGVLLDVKESGQVELNVSYVVSNAGWSPKYDLRVMSADRKMTVSYFGMIQQNTEEDWVDAKLSLSTATPSIGGVVPVLETCNLSLRRPEVMTRRVLQYNSMEIPRGATFISSAPSMKKAVPLKKPQAEVKEGLSSSVFEIETRATIPSDSSQHKVSIATIDLKPSFEYETVPKLSQHAFLKAIVKNNSSYPLLAGPANAFLDNSFVTTTKLTNVSPNEDFSCCLGADPSVRITYKPIQRFRQEAGLVSKTVQYRYKQVTEVKNTRSEATVLTFNDQIPLSKDEKLKVTLSEPVLVKSKPGQPPANPHLTSKNHLMWKMNLKANESKTITVQYTVEYPRYKQIEGL